MNTSRPLLKNNARIIIRTARPSVITAGLIFVAVLLLLGTLSNSVLGVNISYDEAQQYMNYYLRGDLEALVRLSESMAPPASAYLLNVLIQAVLYIFTAGFLIFILNTVKKAGAVYGNLLDGFSHAGRLLLLALLQWLFISLWSLLFIVLTGVMDCIRTSKQMMQGHKWELFVLDLSFIGWRLLTAVPYIGYAVQIWTAPYLNTTYVLYYMALSGKPVTVFPEPGQSPYL